MSNEMVPAYEVVGSLTREQAEEVAELLARGSVIWVLGHTNPCAGAEIRPALGAGRGGERETGWLVENGSNQTMYRGMDSSGPFWTDDHSKAIRFARRKDAEDFCAGDEDAWKVVEHMWCGERFERAPQPMSLETEILELRRDLARTENARVVLLAELENARKDKALMDWMERDLHQASWKDGERFVIAAGYGDEFTGDTWREAIYAAIAKESSNDPAND